MEAFRRQFKVLLVEAVLLISCFCSVTAKRTKEKMYIDILSKNGCFRLLNGTHQIGCSSGQEGNTGVVHYLQSDEDWNYVLKDGTTGPYVAVLNATKFTTANVERLAKSGRVTGIAVLNVYLDLAAMTDGFSVDKSCPNNGYGLYKGGSLQDCSKVTWNPAGGGLFFHNLNIPIFSITSQKDADAILNKCWKEFNQPATVDGAARPFPLCAMQLVSAMTAAGDSQTCMRRSNLVTNLNPSIFCDPLGDSNIVATVKAVPSQQKRGEKSVIVVATRMDTMGMFFNQFPGGDTTVTGIVTLLATAGALWRGQQDIVQDPNSKDVMFTFLQGEAFDYIGSSRMVYEMQNGRFPVDFSDDDKEDVNLQRINLTHIAQFVELSQVGMRQDENSLWLHVDPQVRNKTGVKTMLDKLTQLGAGTNTTFRSPDPTHPLPPASLQRFLKEASADSPFPSFLVSDHRDSFTNKFYNSHLDLPAQIQADYPRDMKQSQRYDATTVQSQRIAALATALARYLFWASTGGDPNPTQTAALQADIKDVNHMLYCFLHSPHCELFNFTISPDNAEALNKNVQPFPFFVTISGLTNQVTYLTQRILAYFTGQLVPGVQREDCKAKGHDKRYTYLWMQGSLNVSRGERTPVCFKTTALLSKAESPAFDIDGYDYESRQYSTWTESRWDVFKVRVFLLPSKQFQTVTLSVGVIMLIVSLVVVYWISAKADTLFLTAGTSREYLFNNVRS
ncbi:hypothetical protein ACOMHN_042085 [Nucella lapillus]